MDGGRTPPWIADRDRFGPVRWLSPGGARPRMPAGLEVADDYAAPRALRSAQPARAPGQATALLASSQGLEPPRYPARFSPSPSCCSARPASMARCATGNMPAFVAELRFAPADIVAKADRLLRSSAIAISGAQGDGAVMRSSRTPGIDPTQLAAVPQRGRRAGPADGGAARPRGGRHQAVPQPPRPSRSRSASRSPCGRSGRASSPSCRATAS